MKRSGLTRTGRWEELGGRAKGGGAVAGEEAEPPAMFVDALTVKTKRLGILTSRNQEGKNGATTGGHWTGHGGGGRDKRRNSTNQTIGDSLRAWPAAMTKESRNDCSSFTNRNRPETEKKHKKDHLLYFPLGLWFVRKQAAIEPIKIG